MREKEKACVTITPKWHSNTEDEISVIFLVLIYYDTNQSYGYLGNPLSY